MLLRQLQRPSSRSIAVAAWRPTSTVLLYGSSHCLQSLSSSHPFRNHHQVDLAPTNKPLSLFERLFPDEAKHGLTSLRRKRSTKPRACQPFNELENPSSPLTVPEEEHPPDDDYPFTNDALDGELNDDGDDSNNAAPRTKTMLILSAASKQLSLSDFQGLGPRGAHVEGWVGVGGGAARVVPARDPDTLQPLGHYFVLFDSHDAAVAYRDEVERLWSLGKARLVEDGVYRGERKRRRGQKPESWDGGEDVTAALKSFTLVPPSQRYHLELSSGRGNIVDDLDSGDGSFVDQLAVRAGSPHLVLVVVDGGRISVDTLRRAIEEDGVDRNLPWRVTDLENGILPFGKSILKKHDRNFEQHLLDQAGRAAGKTEKGESEDGEAAEETFRRYPRFIVPFEDAAEAHRFVKGWHRRQFKLQMRLDGDGDEDGEEDQVSWDETRTVNASVLW